jgi:hypothetical protein
VDFLMNNQMFCPERTAFCLKFLGNEERKKLILIEKGLKGVEAPPFNKLMQDRKAALPLCRRHRARSPGRLSGVFKRTPDVAPV